MEAVTKRRETDKKVQEIVKKNLTFISSKLDPRDVIEYLFEKGVLTVENREQLQIDLGRSTKSFVTRKLFLDILFRKENCWIHTIKAIRRFEPSSSIASLIESALPEAEKRKLERWYKRHGINTQEDSHCSSVTDSDTSSCVGTDSGYTTKNNLSESLSGRKQKIHGGSSWSKHQRKSGGRGQAYRKHRHRSDGSWRSYPYDNVHNGSFEKHEEWVHGAGSRKKDTVPQRPFMLAIPSPGVLPNPSWRDDSSHDGSRVPPPELNHQPREDTGANRNGQDRNQFETHPKHISVNGSDESEVDCPPVKQQVTNGQSEIMEISEIMESKCSLDTDHPESSTDTDSNETSSYESEYTETEAESIEMGPKTELSTAKPSNVSGSANIRNPPQGTADVNGLQQQMPPPAIPQPMTGPTGLMPQGTILQQCIMMLKNPTLSDAFVPAVPLNYLHHPGFNQILNQQEAVPSVLNHMHQPGTALNPILMNQKQPVHPIQFLYPTQSNLTTMPTLILPMPDSNPNMMNQQQATQPEQQMHLPQPSLVDGVQRMANQNTGPEVNTSKTRSQNSNLPAVSSHSESRKEPRMASKESQPTETNSNMEELYLGENITPTSETAISRDFKRIKLEAPSSNDSRNEATSSTNSKPEAMGSVDSQIDAKSFKDNDPETAKSTINISQTSSFRCGPTYSSRVHKITQMDYGHSEAVLSAETCSNDSETQEMKSKVPVKKEHQAPCAPSSTASTECPTSDSETGACGDPPISINDETSIGNFKEIKSEPTSSITPDETSVSTMDSQAEEVTSKEYQNGKVDTKVPTSSDETFQGHYADFCYDCDDYDEYPEPDDMDDSYDVYYE